jgi:hypothetical protein
VTVSLATIGCVVYQTAPITAKGNEILKWSVGQGGADEADYADLMTVGHHHNHNHILRL